jgi:predicted HTH domain antitoxin
LPPRQPVRRRHISARLLEKLRQLDQDAPLEVEDWVLAYLYASRGKAPSRTHIQKAMFLASLHISELAARAEFNPYRMGPWGEEVNDILERMQVNNLVTSSNNKGSIALTRSGQERAREAWSRLTTAQRQVLREIADTVNRMTVDELLLYIYTVYGYSEKSDVLEKLLRRRRQLAASMLRKGIVSTELAARIAGEPLPAFIRYLRRHGIKPYTAEVNDIDEAQGL